MTILLSTIRWIFTQLTGDALAKAVDLIDSKIDSDVEKEKVKAEVIKTYMTTRASFMSSGGLWLMAIFAIPLALWWSAVIVYSILWCADCIYAQDWTIAALPSPMDEWSGAIIIAIFGVVGVTKFVKK